MVIFHSFLYAYQRVKNLIHWSTMIHCWGLIISFQSNYIGDSEAMVDYVGFAGWSSRLGAMAYHLWTKRSTAWKHNMKAARWTQGCTQGWCLPSVFMGDHLTRRNMQSETVQLTSLGIWNVSLEACQRFSSGQNFTAWLLMLGKKLWQPLICLGETETENSVLQGPSILENAVFYRTASSEVGVGRPVLSREPPGDTSQLTCCLISARGSSSSDLNSAIPIHSAYIGGIVWMINNNNNGSE